MAGKINTRRPTRASPSLSSLVYTRLSDMILQRKLSGGSVIVESVLAEKLHVSRTPMREAILTLTAQGLLVKQGPRSYAVRRVQAHEFFQALQVRELLETQTVRAAVGRLSAQCIENIRATVQRVATSTTQAAEHWATDDLLHQTLADASGNIILAQLVREVRIVTRLFEIRKPLGRVQADAQEHLLILECMANNDVEGACLAMANHLRNIAHDALELVSGRATIRIDSSLPESPISAMTDEQVA